MSELDRSSSKGHARNKSSVARSARPRSSTKGPLDTDDDPLSSPSPSVADASSSIPFSPLSPKSSTGRGAISPRPINKPLPSSPRLGEARPKDFSFLLRPEIYHPLTQLNVPLPFRNSRQPDPDTPIEELLSRGHFRAAAIAAVQELTGSGTKGKPDSQDAERIFNLLYVRLACLCLVDATPLAAQEAKALEDLNDVRKYVDETTGRNLVPWELRVLNVRLQGLGLSDPRRAVMSYYELAREARDKIKRAGQEHDRSAQDLWRNRLQELGIKVTGALIDMNDLSGAAHHLQTLRHHGDDRMAMSKALLWLQVGDAAQARECAKLCSQEDGGGGGTVIGALCDMADAEYDSALQQWQDLRDSHTDEEMVGVNMAVCLLYLGRMQEARTVLESLVDAGLSSHTLLFNLSTMYELCTDKNRVLKARLAEKVAAMDESTRGWEKTNADFKL